MTFDQIYRGYKAILGKTKLFIPLLYEKGRDEGKSVEEIESKLEELGVEYRTAMRYTPIGLNRNNSMVQKPKRLTNCQPFKPIGV